MQLVEAIKHRFSVRAFKDQPVDRAIIEEILTAAVRSPSWGNTQPWEVAVVGGQVTQALTDEFCKCLMAGQMGNSDFAMPMKFSGVYNDRYKGVGKEIFKLKGIGREDHEARLNHQLQNFKAFGAPNLIYLLFDQSLETVYPVFDCGCLAAHICLLAADRGLGTCLLAALAWYPDLIRRYLGLGPEKKVVLGLALGYPDEAAPVNTLKTTRVSLDQIVTWVG